MATAATRQYLFKLLVVAIGYAAISYLSLFLVPPGGFVSIVWPPSAVALAALFLFGFDMWPALLLPLFLVMLGARGLTPPLAAVVALSNTLGALFAAWILQRFDFRPMFDRLQDALVFSMAAIVAPIISATITTFGIHFLSAGSTQSIWIPVWIGHLVSLITFGSFALRWGYKPLFSRTRREWLELLAMFASFIALTALSYWTSYASLGAVPLIYISIIPLIWAALRVAGPRGMTFMLLLMALISATGTLWGFGAVAHAADKPGTLLSVQLVVGVLSLIFLLFTSIVEERKEAVVALRTNIERLQAAFEQIRLEDQAKSDFIAILAHELRNPLSPMLSGLELLKSRQHGPPEVLGMMGAHLNTMARLLDDLLDMSRISQKKFKLQREPLNLKTVLAQSLEMVQPYLNERRQTLTVMEPQEDLWLSADPVRVAQIIVNLLTNASKYTDPGDKIRLEARRAHDDALIEVSDTGIGIDESRLKKIFEPFGATDTGVRRAGGLHIGLSLARRMAELHQGSLTAYSAGLGKGSSFTVKLPLLRQAPLLTTDELVPSQRRRSRFSREAFGQSKALGSLSILVVDDNEAAADSLSQLLRHNNHETKVAYSGEQALELCDSYEPSVALLDIGLPNMDGYELAHRLREKFGDSIMLVALTGYGQAEDKERAHQAGFDDHLTKPVSIVDVEHVLLELSRTA